MKAKQQKTSKAKTPSTTQVGPGQPPRKLDDLLDLMVAGAWTKAIRLAASWRDLGKQKGAIQKAAAALLSPDLYEGMGEDPQEIVAAGKAALKLRYGAALAKRSPEVPAPRVAAPAAKKAAPAASAAAPLRVDLRKYVLLAVSALPQKERAQAEASMRAALPALQAKVDACATLAACRALHKAFLAMPSETALQVAWRQQHMDTVNRRIRALGGGRARRAPAPAPKVDPVPAFAATDAKLAKGKAFLAKKRAERTPKSAPKIERKRPAQKKPARAGKAA